MKGETVRQSNFELLRIVAIFLVMVAHCNSWLGGGLPNSSDGFSGVMIGKYIIASLASICVALFILISGYFSIKPKLKSVVNLWTQIFFIYVYLYVLQVFVVGDICVKGVVMCFLPFSLGNWFVKSYLVLMVLSPALNYFAEKVSRNGFVLFLLCFFMMAFVWGCLYDTEAAGFNKGYSPLSFILIYSVGRYLKLHVAIKQSKYFYLCCYIICSVIIFVGLIFGQHWMLYYCNPILIISAVSLFLFFAKLEIGYSRLINEIASSVFAVFIFHTKEPIVSWLKECNLRYLNTFPFFEYFGLIFLVLIGVFVVAIAMDKLRLLLFKPIIDFANRIVISTTNGKKIISIIKK